MSSFINSKRILIILILLNLSTYICAQSPFNYPYYLFSQNNKYFLISIPYEDQGTDTEGKTEVFKSKDSTLLYTINKYFFPDGIIIDDDGENLCYLNTDIHNITDYNKTLLTFYNKGDIKKEY